MISRLFLGVIDGELETEEQLRAFLEPYSPPAPPPPVTVRRTRGSRKTGEAKSKIPLEAAFDGDAMLWNWMRRRQAKSRIEDAEEDDGELPVSLPPAAKKSAPAPRKPLPGERSQLPGTKRRRTAPSKASPAAAKCSTKSRASCGGAHQTGQGARHGKAGESGATVNQPCFQPFRQAFSESCSSSCSQPCSGSCS